VLSEQKGITHLLAAARTLLQAHPRLRFLIVGGGRLEAALRQEAQALGLEERVVFTGWRQDAAELMGVLDVFVMSSLWEAMPMVLLEAMGARRAIVATDVGDNRRVVADGRAGVVVPPKDSAALARAIEDVVSNPALAAGLREAAYDEYVARFSVGRMLANHETLYARIASLEAPAAVADGEMVESGFGGRR
jgi:glycosyltransferase involved in cell wall biosynthesis